MPDHNGGTAASRPLGVAGTESSSLTSRPPRDIAAAANELLALLDPCRETYIHWLRGRGADKEPRHVHHPVTIEAVERHLSPTSLGGPGSLGFFLERSGAVGFETSTLALDFDQYNPAGMRTLVDTLDAHDICAYTTRGSSGRGHHLYIFIDSPIPLSDGHKALLALADMATASGFDKVEIRPSNGRGRGIGLLAPYRGAGDDGLGFNPLTDPRSSSAPVLLWHLSEVQRNPIRALLPSRHSPIPAPVRKPCLPHRPSTFRNPTSCIAGMQS